MPLSRTQTYRLNKKAQIIQIATKYIQNLTSAKNQNSVENQILINSSFTSQSFETENSFSNNQSHVDSHEMLDTDCALENEIRLEFEDSQQNEEISYDIESISASLLGLFYAGNFTQDQLAKIIEFTQLFCKEKIPKKFNNLANTLNLNLKNNYNKIWHCQQCNQKIELEHNKQRNCKTCKSK